MVPKLILHYLLTMNQDNNDAAPPFGFNVIAYISANVGVGVAARHIVRLLLDKGYPVAILDMDSGLQRGGHDHTFSHLTVQSPQDLPYSVNLIILFIPALPAFFLNPSALAWRSDRLTVGIVWWELPVLPKLWIEALQLFDVVIAGSAFVRSVLESHLSGVWVIYAPQPIYCPAEVKPSRSRFGLPDDVVLFATSFEPHSDPERKNPFAVIEAFRCAFPGEAPV